jgi:hypothetical protein
MERIDMSQLPVVSCQLPICWSSLKTEPLSF